MAVWLLSSSFIWPFNSSTGNSGSSKLSRSMKISVQSAIGKLLRLNRISIAISRKVGSSGATKISLSAQTLAIIKPARNPEVFSAWVASRNDLTKSTIKPADCLSIFVFWTNISVWVNCSGSGMLMVTSLSISASCVEWTPQYSSGLEVKITRNWGLTWRYSGWLLLGGKLRIFSSKAESKTLFTSGRERLNSSYTNVKPSRQAKVSLESIQFCLNSSSILTTLWI